MKRAFFALGATVLLAGCQTNYQYVRMGPGPELPYAQAQCEIMSNGVQQGVIAWGSPGYVAGAQLGNAIGNAIRVDQFMKNCMIMQGWQRVPVKTSTPGAAKPTYTPAPPLKSAGKFPPPPKLPGA
ncbi:MAG: membrane lipoprotein lipid attachment site-containing protein [Mesorhizobium sp.]|nr:membrane lipoprotein lipid attachment site-containing protein [Mesorhizobium sp.]MBN9243425.1 membrane lipoprotein lipid attachment site-containing protein [Mesorhizobium sp.]